MDGGLAKQPLVAAPSLTRFDIITFFFFEAPFLFPAPLHPSLRLLHMQGADSLDASFIIRCINHICSQILAGFGPISSQWLLAVNLLPLHFKSHA